VSANNTIHGSRRLERGWRCRAVASGWADGTPSLLDNRTILRATLPVRRHPSPGVTIVRRSSILLVIAFVAVVSAVGWSASPARAAGGSVDLDQWASSDRAWQNGNLNGNNSRYPEGGIVPFRLAMEGLKAGSHSIHINYDFTAGGHKAYDFLATWNVTNAAGKICTASGGAISSMCPSMPASSSFAFPSDGFLANGLRVSGAEAYSGSPRRLTIWGGTITSIQGPTHAGSVNGNSTADFLVRFTSTGNAVLLAWGGHLAQSSYWDKADGGAPDGAAQVSGAPWHMRTLQLDGSGNKNQDRSIQPSAIVGELAPQALAPATPRPTAAPTPAAPRTTTRPTAAPTPGGPRPPDGGTTGNPAGPASAFPRLTPPATSTDDELPAPMRDDGAGILAASAMLLGMIALAARRPATRPRRGS
jgi:hypothetical protein